MRAPVHPDRPGLLVRADVLADRDRLLGRRVAFLPDPQAQRPAIDVSDRVHLALVLGQHVARGVPAQRELASRLVDRKAQKVRERWPGAAIEAVFPPWGRPVSREVPLRERAGRREDDQDDEYHRAHGFQSTVMAIPENRLENTNDMIDRTELSSGPAVSLPFADAMLRLRSQWPIVCPNRS